MTRIRVQKFLSEAGVCSRRQAERWLVSGRIRVNGEVVTTLGTQVDPKEDVVEADGHRVEARPRGDIVLMMHKPPGYVCTAKDPQGRRTVYDLLPKDMPRVFSVGRLDYPSEGLLLFTNDGELANAMMHPSRGVLRTYEVKVKGHPTRRAIQAVSRGVDDEQGHRMVPVEVAFLRRTRKNCWYRVSVTEGRNREIRRIFEGASLEVIRLVRTRYGPVELGDLALGATAPIEEILLRKLRDACGLNDDSGPRRKLMRSTAEPGPPMAPRDREKSGRGR